MIVFQTDFLYHNLLLITYYFRTAVRVGAQSLPLRDKLIAGFCHEHRSS